MTSQDASLSEAVLTAVADREGVEPRGLEQPLYEVVDPEALDALFKNGRGKISFEYMDYAVTVDDEGNVELTPVED